MSEKTLIDADSASAEDAPLLEVRNLTKQYISGTVGPSWLPDVLQWGSIDRVRALNSVSFSIDENETLGVVGESGCGKSTLGLSILRLVKPTSGEVYFKGKDVTSLSTRELRRLRKEIQIIFQNPTSALNPRMKVKKLIKEPLKNFHDINESELEIRIEDLLKQVDLPIEFKERYPHELSGGQQQRVVIARALAPDPALIVADEPVTGLDVSIQAKIINLLQDIQETRELSFLFIAHNLTVIRHISDRTMVLYLGDSVELGDTDTVFENPQHPYTRELKRAIPRSHPDDSRDIQPLEGEPPSPTNPPSGCPFHPRCPAYIGPVCEEDHPDSVSLEDGRQVACHHFDDGNQLAGENYGKRTTKLSGDGDIPVSEGDRA